MNKNHFIKTIMLTCTISGITFLAMSPATAKQYYKWVDSKGSTHYTSKPPPKTAKMKGKVDTYGWQGSSTTTTQTPSTANQTQVAAPYNPTATSSNTKQNVEVDQQQREANEALKNGAIEKTELR